METQAESMVEYFEKYQWYICLAYIYDDSTPIFLYEPPMSSKEVDLEELQRIIKKAKD